MSEGRACGIRPRWLALLVAGVLAAAPVIENGRARAQGSGALPPREVPGVGAEDFGGVEGEESPELRALRLVELEVFGREQPLVETSPTVPRPLRLSVPEALSSDAQRVDPATGSAGTARDLSWLEGLTLPDIPVRWDERVIRYLELFRDDPRARELIRSWLRRVERFGPTIRRALRTQGLPEDLIYVGMIESGFDPRARSDAGAVGLWQFVARTAEEYGLRQDHWVDMRMDPEASTEAAARYLAALHRRFGTWELALAAYNMGYGALLRAIRKYDTNDYWELSHLEAALPFETSLYVAKVMACAIVGRNPERFGLADLAREAPIETDTVEVPGGTPLALIARAAGTTPEEVRRLNPALRRDRVPPGSARFAVRIPAGRRDTFARAWERVRPRDPVHRPYVVRFGEDLAAIAWRFRTSVRALRELNQLTEEDRVGAGFAMMVPAVTPRERARPDEPPVVAIPPGRFEYPDRRRVFYRVQRHDDLAEIARFFQVREAEICQWNAIDPRAALHEGMFLQLFVPTRVDLATAVVMTPEEVRTLVIGSEEFYEWHVRQEGRVRIRYRVRPGDTLSEIARRFGLDTASMARINQIPRDATLRVGQELIVYTTPDRAEPGLEAVVAGADASPADASPADAPAADASAADASAADAAIAVLGAPAPEPAGEPSIAGDAPIAPAVTGAEHGPDTAPLTPGPAAQDTERPGASEPPAAPEPAPDVPG